MERSWIIAFGVIVLAAFYSLFDQGLGEKPEPGAYLTIEDYSGGENLSEFTRFSNLTDGQQNAVTEELETENRTLIPEDVRFQAFIENRYLRYQNNTYNIAVAEN
jgi:hypothetical protein